MIECTHHDCRCARAAELADQGRTPEAVLVHQQRVRCRRAQEPPAPLHPEDEPTLRGLGPSPGASGGGPDPADRTSTLKGLGFTSLTLRGLGRPNAAALTELACPCCRVKADEVSTDLAACLGVAIVFVKGADAARAELCPMHARLLRLLVDELRAGPKRLGKGASWDD